MKQQLADYLVKETECGYDLISEKFSQTRNHFWKELKFVEKYLSNGDKVLDYGCGNGRLLNILNKKEFYYYGLDISQKLINLAQEKYANEKIIFKKIKVNQQNILFPDNYFNIIYSVATLHHIPGIQYRENLIKEFYRILKPGGYIVITVWDLWRKKYRKKIFKNWIDKIIGKSVLDWNDCYIGFKDNKGHIFERYHHAFRKGELQKIFEKNNFEIEKCRRIGGNIVLIGKKLADIEKGSIILSKRLKLEVNNAKK